MIWPYLEVEPRWYRFRIANTANSRIYRLMLLADGEPVPGAFQVIGTDQGLIDTPLPVEGALNLSSGERVDVLVDFSAYRGRSLKLVNTMEGVPPGSSSTRHDLLEPDVMQFRVAARGSAGRFTPPAVLSPTFERPSHHDLPHDGAPRWVVIVGPGTENVPELWEMEEVTDTAGITFPAAGIVQVRDAEGTLTTLRRTALHYDDGRAFTVAHGSTEIWKYLNLAASPPPHAHPPGPFPRALPRALRRDRLRPDRPGHRPAGRLPAGRGAGAARTRSQGHRPGGGPRGRSAPARTARRANWSPSP
ncbi:hypothetical protein GCM10020256_01020 [Streptomyces thermocoprophilus]